MADHQGNFYVFTLLRNQKMECIADFHAGLKVHSLNRLENGFLFPSAEGAVGALFPVSE